MTVLDGLPGGLDQAQVDLAVLTAQLRRSGLHVKGGPAAPPELTKDGHRVREEFEFSLPFAKAGTLDEDRGEVKGVKVEKGDLILKGYASTFAPDRDGEQVVPEAFDNTLKDYLENNPIVLWQHNMDWPIGVVTKAETDETGLYVEVVIKRITSDAPDWHKTAWNSIKSGIVRTFSIGGYFWREWKQGLVLITEVELMEISVVSIPANAASIFEAAVKAVRGRNQPVVTDVVVKQMAQVIGAEPISDPELAAMNAGQLRHREQLLAGEYVKAGFAPPSRDEFESIADRAKQADQIGEEGLIQLATDAAKFTARLHAHEPVSADSVKAGRVLSAKNRDRLQAAYDALGAVLEEAKADSEDADDEELAAAA
jgi:HK97 family phage prohead protease